MRMMVYAGLCLLLLAPMARAADDVSAIKGTVTQMDAKAKTLSVRTAEGAEHVVQVVSNTVVYGFGKTTKGAHDAFRSLKEGSDVVVHYTRKGATEIALEVDHVGTEGLQRAEGVLTRIDRSGKRLIVKTAAGAEETYRLADHAARDAGADVEHAGKVVVYYLDEGGRKVVHFFEKAM